MKRPISSLSILLCIMVLAALLVSNQQVLALTATPSKTPTFTALPALPDLSVVSITEFTYTPATPTANPQGCWMPNQFPTIGLRVTIQNTGTVAAGTFAVNLNGSVLMVSSLAAGQTTTVDYMGQTLTRTRTATVDSTGLVAESDESNNTLTLNLSAATSTTTRTPLPTQCAPTKTPTIGIPNGVDLIISSITSAGSTPVCANQNRANIVVHNMGNTAAGTFSVSVNGTQYGVTGLGAGQSVTITVPLVSPITAVADSTSVIAETNEGNNSLTVNLPLPSQAPTCTPTPTITRTPTGPGLLPDLVISSITYVGSNPACTNQPKDNVVVSNIGNATAGAFYVSINGNQTPISGLAAGQSITLTVPATTSITTTADSTNTVSESNESNNTASANLPIPTQAPTCTPTFTATPTPSITRTPTPFCITATPERILVAPVTSPTSATTQVISVTLNNGVSVTITSEAGSFTSTTKVGNVFSVTINLVPNSTNHLQVSATVNASNLCAPYTVGTTVDSNGNPLTIVQSGSPVTPTITRTITPTRTLSITPVLNLAWNKPVTCSSVENTTTACAKAVDGNTTTRWSSAFADPQWISIDLGFSRPIGRVVLRWEAAYGKSYQIQTSNDGVTWTAIYVTTTGDGGVDDLSGLNANARYIRMFGTVRATQYGYSLWEFEVYQ